MPPVLPTERIAHLGTADCCIHPPGRNEMIAITPSPLTFAALMRRRRMMANVRRKPDAVEKGPRRADPARVERPVGRIVRGKPWAKTRQATNDEQGVGSVGTRAANAVSISRLVLALRM
jgi:hypothetical protein